MQALEELLNIGHSFSSSTYPSNEVYLLCGLLYILDDKVVLLFHFNL